MRGQPGLRFVNWSEVGNARKGQTVVPVATISLDIAHERRRLMKEAGMPPAFVDGYWPGLDSRNLDQADFDKFVDLESYTRLIGGTPSPGLIGCTVSQRDALDTIVASGAPLGLIFEDDVRPVRPDAFDILATLMEPLHTHADRGAAFLCHLGVMRSQRPRAPNQIVCDDAAIKAGRWLIRDAGVPRFFRAHAYVISNAAARRTVAGETPMRVGSDHFFQRFNLRYFDRAFFVEPGLFSQDHSLRSYIQGTAAPTDTAAEMGRLSLQDRMRRLRAQRVRY